MVRRGLLRLEAWAFMVGLFVAAFKATGDLVALISFGVDGVGFGALISLAINVVILGALWSGRASFPRSAPAGA